MSVSADTMSGISEDAINVISYGEEGSNEFSFLRRLRFAVDFTPRHLAVNTNVSVEIYYTVTGVAEQNGYTDPYAFASYLQDDITTGYLSSGINTAFVQQAEEDGSATINSNTEVKFLAPRFGSNLQITVVRTTSPTVAPTNIQKRGSSSSSNDSFMQKYQYFVAGGVGLLVLVIITTVACCCCRKPAEKSNIDKDSTDPDFENIDFYGVDKSGEVSSQFASEAKAGKRNVMKFGFVPGQARGSGLLSEPGGSFEEGNEAGDVVMVDMSSVRPPQPSSSATSASAAADTSADVDEEEEDREGTEDFEATRKEQLLKKASSIGMPHPQIRGVKQSSQIRKKRSLEKTASSTSQTEKET